MSSIPSECVPTLDHGKERFEFQNLAIQLEETEVKFEKVQIVLNIQHYKYCFFSQKPKTIKDENVGPDSYDKDFKSMFDDSFSSEFNKERITEIFDILHVQERDDLVKELENVFVQYSKLKVQVHRFYISIKKYDFWEHELPLLSE